MSRYRILSFTCSLAITLAMAAATATAQGRHHAGGGSARISMGGSSGRVHIGTNQPSGFSGYGYGYGSAITPAYYSPLYYGGYSYGGFAPTYFTQVLQPYPVSSSGGPVVIVMSAPAPPQIETIVIYVPSYMRPNPGVSLGEIARELRAQKERSRTN